MMNAVPDPPAQTTRQNDTSTALKVIATSTSLVILLALLGWLLHAGPRPASGHSLPGTIAFFLVCVPLILVSCLTYFLIVAPLWSVAFPQGSSKLYALLYLAAGLLSGYLLTGWIEPEFGAELGAFVVLQQLCKLVLDRDQLRRKE